MEKEQREGSDSEFDPGSDEKKDINGLTGKMEMFCQFYVGKGNFNKRESAKLAGYAAHCAHSSARDLYKMPKIRARIKELLAERRVEFHVNDERLQTEIARLAFFDPTELFDELKGKTLLMSDIKALPKSKRACIKGIKMGKFGLELQFHDKTQALEMLAKHLGYFEKDNSQKAVSGVAIMLPDNSRGDRNDDVTPDE